MTLAALGVANALLLLWGGAQADSSTRQLIATLGGAALGCAALLWLAFDERFARVPLRWVFALALLLRAVAAFALPLLEDDHHRYLWDGWRTATTLDPYRLPPSAWFGETGLPEHWQEVLNAINHPDIPTIYGPVLQALFALGHAIAPAQLWPLQGLLVLADLALLFLLARHGVGARWLLVYALHPLVLKEAVASAHPDALVAFFLLLTLVAWQRGQAVIVGMLLGLAVATKVSALVVLPLLLWAPARDERHDALRWALSVGAAGVATVALLYLPFITGGGSDAAALSVFSTTWRFNPLLYRVVEAVLPAAAARPAAALLIIAGIAVIASRWRRQTQREPDAPPPLDAALVLLLLLSPVVNPWYWLWVLALSVHMRRTSVVAIAAVSALSYVNSSVVASLAGSQPFFVPWPVACLQLLVFFAVGCFAQSLARLPTPRTENAIAP